MHIVEREIREKYRYSNLSYIFDVYMECEYRANLTQEEYEGLSPGEFRFDYESWSRRLGFSKKQMERAIKELTTESKVIEQKARGHKGTCSKYYLTRFQENNKEHNKESNRRTINVENTTINKDRGEQKECRKEHKKEHSSRYSNQDIVSNNIYSANAEQFAQHIWSLYPKKKGKKIAIESIKNILKKYSVEELELCVSRYATEVRLTEDEFILNGSTFFNGRFIDFLDENYKEKKEKKHTGFNNFQSREYDYDELEKKLLGWD